MFSNNPIKDITDGILEWSFDKIVGLVKKLKEKKLAFIQDKKTIEIVKEQYHSGEWKFYQTYVDDKELLFLIKLGLTLKKLEEDKERLDNLQDKIFLKYKVNGLHIAQFVQNGILNRYVGILIDELTNVESFKRNIKEILDGIEKCVLFVKGTDNPRFIIQKATTIVTSHSPAIFIVSGITPASEIVRECVDRLKSLLIDYELEKISSGKKEILFFKRILKK